MEMNLTVTEAQTNDALALARAFAVVDKATEDEAWARSKALSAMKNGIKADFKVPKKELDDAKDKLLALEKKYLTPVIEAEGIYDQKIMAHRAKERMRLEEERRRVEEAARKAEEERLLAEAQHLESQGMKEESKAVIETPLPSIAVSAAPKPKLQGGSEREYWSGECLNLMLLVKAVAEGKASIGLLQLNSLNLNKLAQLEKRNFNVPGCRAVMYQGLVKRA